MHASSKIIYGLVAILIGIVAITTIYISLWGAAGADPENNPGEPVGLTKTVQDGMDQLVP